jgi:oxygen-independent coproporphyrinogen-3 oxidase
VEIDPTEIDAERILLLAARGLTRASIGIQDFEPAVQRAIGREQSVEATEATVLSLRAAGVRGLNFDLLYGLPFQTRTTLRCTLDAALRLDPGRLALYGYAHVPWMSQRQSLVPTDALPSAEARFDLFEMARERLLAEGFVQVGIDHFARPDDPLARAAAEGRLARSFQGYTDDRVARLVGFGTSAISKYPQGYVQNEVATARYQACITEGRGAAARGVALTVEDRARAELIEHLMCYYAIDRAALTDQCPAAEGWLTALSATYPDAVRDDGRTLSMAPWAHPLVRVVAADLAGTTSAPARYSAAI